MDAKEIAGLESELMEFLAEFDDCFRRRDPRNAEAKGGAGARILGPVDRVTATPAHGATNPTTFPAAVVAQAVVAAVAVASRSTSSTSATATTTRPPDGFCSGIRLGFGVG